MAAISRGEVSAAASQRLLQALVTHVRIVTAGDLEQHLAALERGRTAPRPVTIDSRSGRVEDVNLQDLA